MTVDRSALTSQPCQTGVTNAIYIAYKLVFNIRFK